MMQSVTLAIPTFNRPKLLDATPKSAVRQDYPDLKIVVSDNATEGVETRSTVERYMRDDPRISYSMQSENRRPGPLAARSRGGSFDVALRR
jgi:glycosyltransferase involved in cell wall biosynthesis